MSIRSTYYLILWFVMIPDPRTNHWNPATHIYAESTQKVLITFNDDGHWTTDFARQPSPLVERLMIPGSLYFSLMKHLLMKEKLITNETWAANERIWENFQNLSLAITLSLAVTKTMGMLNCPPNSLHSANERFWITNERFSLPMIYYDCKWKFLA